MTVGRWLLAQTCAIAIVIGCLPMRAQAQERPLRIGFLLLHSFAIEEPLIELLKARGLVEGKSLVIERRRADTRPERLPALAAELVRARVDVIVAYTNAPAFAAREATRDVPIVVWGAHDAVGTGLVASLARPAGNVTGVESMAPLLDAKRVQFLRELRPQMKRLGVLYNPNDQGATKHLWFAREAAASFGITVLPIEVRTRDDGPAAVAEMEGQRLDALLVVADPIANFAFDRVAQAAAKIRLPTMCEFREFVKRGCLVGYGATLNEFNERVAGLVEQVLRGARPADLPIQQVTRLEFILNQRIAREIDVAFPQAMLLRADAVID